MGVVSFVHRTATIFIFFSDAIVVQYVGHRPAHILVQNRQDRPRGFYRVGQKVRKKNRIFHHFETLRPYISETIKNRGI